MTVAELIEKLQAMPQEQAVFVNYDGLLEAVEDVASTSYDEQEGVLGKLGRTNPADHQAPFVLLKLTNDSDD